MIMLMLETKIVFHKIKEIVLGWKLMWNIGTSKFMTLACFGETGLNRNKFRS